ncbi:uncharacterized [Tachysurus ichikawai]
MLHRTTMLKPYKFPHIVITDINSDQSEAGIHHIKQTHSEARSDIFRDVLRLTRGAESVSRSRGVHGGAGELASSCFLTAAAAAEQFHHGAKKERRNCWMNINAFS